MGLITVTSCGSYLFHATKKLPRAKLMSFMAMPLSSMLGNIAVTSVTAIFFDVRNNSVRYVVFVTKQPRSEDFLKNWVILRIEGFILTMTSYGVLNDRF